MRSANPYKSWLLFGESFQRESHGPWTSQYLAAQGDGAARGYGFPSQQYQLSEVFSTEEEADDFALSKAREWIDRCESN